MPVGPVATGRAGNRTEQLTFATTTSTRESVSCSTGSRRPTGAYTALSEQLRRVRQAEAAGNDAKAVRELRQFLALISPSRVPDADIRGALDRDARAVLDSIEGWRSRPPSMR